VEVGKAIIHTGPSNLFCLELDKHADVHAITARLGAIALPLIMNQQLTAGL
jgi:hypothetical protein